MIYIAKDHNDYTVSIVNARNKKLAVAFWQGAGIIPHAIKSLNDFTPIEESLTGVYPILTTEVQRLYKENCFSSRDMEVVTVKRG